MKNTTDHYDRVKTFMKLAGQDTPDEPIFPSLEIRKLRATLILEEAMETIYALGFCVQEGSKDNEFIVYETTSFNQVEVVDGCIDISVVTIGTLIACGIPDLPFLEEVDKNNVEKILNGTIIEDGKLIKSPDHKPQRIQEILLRLHENTLP